MKNEKNKCAPGIMLYNDMLQTLTKLPGDKLKIMLDAISSYHLRKEEPVLEDSLMYLWPMIRQRLDNDAQHYEESRVQNRINGLISSFKRTYAPANGIDPNDSAAMGKYLLSKGVSVDRILWNMEIDSCQRPLTVANEFNQ